MDAYESTFVIKDTEEKYIHNERNIRKLEEIKQIKEYIQKINKADYNWRWDESIKEVWEKAEDCELEAYVDYMVIIRNEAEIGKVKIAELANYYEKSLIYKDKYRDYEETSWAVIRNEELEETGENIYENKIHVDWSENSKYGDTNDYPEFNKMYTKSLEELELKKGEYIELHIVFNVAKDEKGIMLDEANRVGKRSYTEINGYKTINYKNYNEEDGSIAGLIDKNSRPRKPNPI